MKKRKYLKILGIVTGLIIVVSISFSLVGCGLFDSSSDSNLSSESGTSSETNSSSGTSDGQFSLQDAYDMFHNHVYTCVPDVGYEPTCTQDGYGTYTCECGATYSGIIPMTGHDLYVNSDGLYRCANCGMTWSLVNGDGHYYTEAIYVPATDEEDEKWVAFCTDETCKYMKEVEPGELSSYTRAVTAEGAFGALEEEENTAYGQSADDCYRVLESGKYVLKKDISASLKIPRGASVEIDLNGKSLTPESGTHTIFVLPAATLTIYDSSMTNSGCVFAGENGSAVYNKEGTATLSSGSYVRVGDDVYKGSVTEPLSAKTTGRAFAVIENKGDMVIESATVSATYTYYSTETKTEVVTDENGDPITDDEGNNETVEIEEENEETRYLSDRPLIVNGYLDDSSSDEYMGKNVDATLKIEGGTCRGGTYIENELFGSLEISGNANIQCAEGCVRTYGDLTIYDGTYSAVEGNVIEILGNETTQKIATGRNFGATIYIEGGSFASAVSVDDFTFAVKSDSDSAMGANIYIAGGVFKGSFGLEKLSEEPKEYVFESMTIYAGEFVSWPGESNDDTYTYEFLYSGSGVEHDMDTFTVQVMREDHVHSYVATWEWALCECSCGECDEGDCVCDDGGCGCAEGDCVCAHYVCEVTLTCQEAYCAEKIVVIGSEDVTVSGPETISATCTNKAGVKYTATCEYEGVKYEDTYLVEEGDMLPHTYGGTDSVVWKWDPKYEDGTVVVKATCTFTCDECGDQYPVDANITVQSDGTYLAECKDKNGNIYWSRWANGEILEEGKGAYSGSN